jgi:hypothetical protein
VRKFRSTLCSKVKEGDAHREVELDDHRAAAQEGGDKGEDDAEEPADKVEDERDQRANADARVKLV